MQAAESIFKLHKQLQEKLEEIVALKEAVKVKELDQLALMLETPKSPSFLDQVKVEHFAVQAMTLEGTEGGAEARAEDRTEGRTEARAEVTTEG
jgi:hypothetical protein